jgi:acyl-CoA synthetase (AMP-forming)/AMP-acid ligase II
MSASTLEDVPGFIQCLAHAHGIPQAVAAHAARMPDHAFLILERDGQPPLTMTYARLLRRAHAYAAAYQRRDLASGSLVVLMLVAHPDLAPAFLGAMMAGLIPTVFPPMTPKVDPTLFYAGQAELFARLDLALLVTEAPHAEGIAAHLPDFAHLVQRVEEVPDAEAPGDAAPAPDGIAFLQHSSGTTGTKKGVVLTHRAVLDFVAALATALRAQERDIIASWLPLYHDMGLIGCLILPMVLGLTVVQMDPFEWVTRPAMLLDGIRRNRATLCWMPNFAFHHIMRTVPKPEGVDLSSMRAFIDCSEPCKPETLRLFAAHFAACGLRPTALQVSYGMAENVFIATQTDMDGQPATVMADMASYSTAGVIRDAAPDAQSLEFVSVGPSIPGTRLRILGPDGTVLPDRQVGQIAVTSPYLFSGYFRRPTPAGTIVDGWYMSGDLGFMIGGDLFVCGRMDDLLIINGRNIYAHDVEYVVNRDTPVKPGRCVAIAPFNPRLGSQSLVMIAETTTEAAQERLALARRIRAVIQAAFGVAAYDVRVMAPGWMVKTSSGKISRSGNITKYLAEFPIG